CQSQVADHPYAHHHVLVIGYVIAGPYGSVALHTGIACAGEYKRTFSVQMFSGTVIRAASHLKAVDITRTSGSGLVAVKIKFNMFGQHVSPSGDLVHVVPETFYA